MAILVESAILTRNIEKKIETCKVLFITMLITVLFIIAKTENNLIVEQQRANTLQYTHTMKSVYYLNWNVSYWLLSKLECILLVARNKDHVCEITLQIVNCCLNVVFITGINHVPWKALEI